MAVQLIVDNIVVPVKVVKYSDGGSNIKLEVPQKLLDNPPSAYYSISVDPITKVDDYLWEIALVNDSINRLWGWSKFKTAILNLPYLPHARADRVFENGNPHPLDVFFTTVEPCFDRINLTDPHSEYYKNFEQWLEFDVKSQHQCFIEVVGNDIKSGDVLIAPDKGSLKKIYKLQQALDTRTIATFVVEAGKKRDIETGRVIETTLPDCDFNGKTIWIVDDLLDFGGTFIPLAKLLKERGAAKVNLYVTHFIGGKGLDLFKGIIDNIYTYQTVGNYVNRIDIDNFNKGVI